MDQQPQPFLSPSAPRLHPRTHTRTPSRSPTRNRLSVNDDIFADLSPARTLEAFTHPSGRLKASIEAATQTDRAFGIRAALASKNIQEWVDELEEWTWPTEGGSLAFEVPVAKRRKLSNDFRTSYSQLGENGQKEIEEPQYIGSLPAPVVLEYESRIEQIHTEMDDLHVEEIKRQVLDTHFSPRSRPSSSASNAPPSLLSSYTRMDDFTAIVTATVLKALPNLSRLIRLMDVWSVRLNVLRKVPRLLRRLEEAEVALTSGWTAIQVPGLTKRGESNEEALSRETFGIMRNILQDKVTTLGQDLDYMLDTLEGREDTLPDAWLDRMEAIEHDYGEWAVAGDRKVREGEWAKMAKMRKEKEEMRRGEEAARLKAEKEAQEAEAEAARLRIAREVQEAENAKLKAEKNAADAEVARRKAEEVEAAQLKAEKEAQEARAEAARQKAEKEAQEAEDVRLKAEQVAAELARLKAEEVKEAEAEMERQRAKEKDAEFARQKAEIEAQEAEAEAEALRLKAEKEAQEAEAASLRAKQDAADAEASRQKAEKAEAEASRQRIEQEAKDAAAAKVRAEQAAEAIRRKAESEAMEAEATRLKTLQDSQEIETAELARLKAISDADAEAARMEAKKIAEDQRAEAERVEALIKKEGVEAARQELVLVQNREVETEEQSQRLSDNLVPKHAIGAVAGLQGTMPNDSNQSVIQHNDEEPSISVTKYSPFDGSSDFKNEASQLIPETPASIEVHRLPGNSVETQIVPKMKLTDVEQLLESPSTDNLVATNPPPKQTLDIFSNHALDYSESTEEDHTVEELMHPRTPTEISRLGHTFSDELPRSGSPEVLTEDHPEFLGSPDDQTAGSKNTKSDPEDIPIASATLSTPSKSTSTAAEPIKATTSDHLTSKEPKEEQWVDAKFPSPGNNEAKEDFSAHDPSPFNTEDYDNVHSKVHKKNLSLPPGYSVSDSTPEIHEAEPAEYFRPMLSPVKSARSSTVYSEPITPKSPFHFSSMMAIEQTSPTFGDPEIPMKSPKRSEKSNETQSTASRVSRVVEDHGEDVPEVSSGDGASESALRDVELHEFRPPVLAHKISITRISSVVRQVSTPRRESVSSSGSTVVNGQASEGRSSPPRASTPNSEQGAMGSFREDDEPSPSIRRHRNGKSHDYSSPDSPPPIPDLSSHRSFPHRRNSAVSGTTEASFSSTTAVDASSASLDTPILDNVDVSSTPLSSPKKSNTDDQMQQQISSLLESIPARIRLTTEPESNPLETLNIKKTRRSVTPSLRSSSSLSTYSRAPTPSFTLAPAYGKGPSRQRPQNGNPEIKLYHLSRSTGEAPIKLFVRLVGENGERVMVRVGGGWADLGEYLKEYASHHGRRSGVADDDKVEIQDLPPRIVSTSSSTSTATIRGNGRSSPVSRPGSAFDRPMSSLNIRKTRKSTGTGDLELPSPTISFRSPSTPLPSIVNRSKQYETPPSVASSSTSASTSASGNGNGFDRSSSRLSWTEEESSLGLAGPKSKKVAISERDQEWVESMKEKVRQASAEKERKQRGTSFGEMDRVGGTKRLFRKG